MKSFVERLYLKEINFQGVQAIDAYEDFVACLDTHRPAMDIFSFLDDFVDHCSRVSLLIWPPKGRKPQNPQQEAANTFREMRGNQLSKALGVDGDHPINSRRLRDHLHHFDERLDSVLSGEALRLADSNIYPKSKVKLSNLHEVQMLRHFDPESFEYSFRDECFNVVEMYDGVRDIVLKVQSRMASMRDY